MTLAILCSGQGRQDPAMLDLFADAPILTEASALLGRDVRALLAGGPLHDNRTSQILCVTRGLAAAACIAPVEPFLLAGYSVGELAAWGIAGCWSPERTLRLAAIRAELMDRTGGPDDRLGFVRGLPGDVVAALVGRFDCAISIVNPNQLFVIGGERAQVERCCAEALAAGAAAARLIDVHVASHTPRLSPAVTPFLEALADTPPSRPLPGRTLISAAHASIAREPGDLAAQIANTIDWAATLEALVERGVSRVLELGPGTVLADMMRGAYPNVDARAVDDFRSLDGITAWLAR